jgi:hypothetical protein
MKALGEAESLNTWVVSRSASLLAARPNSLAALVLDAIHESIDSLDPTLLESTVSGCDRNNWLNTLDASAASALVTRTLCFNSIEECFESLDVSFECASAFGRYADCGDKPPSEEPLGDLYVAFFSKPSEMMVQVSWGESEKLLQSRELDFDVSIEQQHDCQGNRWTQNSVISTRLLRHYPPLADKSLVTNSALEHLTRMPPALQSADSVGQG